VPESPARAGSAGFLRPQDPAARPRPVHPRPAHHAREAADLVRDLGGDV